MQFLLTELGMSVKGLLLSDDGQGRLLLILTLEVTSWFCFKQWKPCFLYVRQGFISVLRKRDGDIAVTLFLHGIKAAKETRR